MLRALVLSALVVTSGPATMRPAVQVVGISRQSDPAHWWSPDGSPIAPPAGLQKQTSGKGWLGVRLSDVAADLKTAKGLGYPGKAGVLVQDVFVDSPAKGVLKTGDILSELEGKPVAGVGQFVQSIVGKSPGAKVKMKRFRGEAFEDVEIALGEQRFLGSVYLPNSSQALEGYRLVLRMTPWDAGDHVAIGAVQPESKTVRASEPVVREKRVGQMEVGILVPATQPTATIDVGVASGPWQTMVQCTEPSKGATRKFPDGRSILVQKVVGQTPNGPSGGAANAPVITSYMRAHVGNVERSMILREGEQPAKAFVDVMQSFPGTPVNDLDFRLMASAGDKTVQAVFGYSQTHDKQRVDRYGIQAEPEEVDLILLQSREWQRASLRDIALKPNVAATKP